MKLEKLLKKYVTFRTRLLIKVMKYNKTEKLVSTDLFYLYDEHQDLLDMKVLHLEVNNNHLCVTVERSA